MDTFVNALLGIVFLLLGIAGTLLMYKLWGYPFDKERLKSSAPPGLMLLHRSIGYAYGAMYIVLMWQMVPRLWTYEVELPARTVAHMVMGISIGVILLTKVAIVRFFKHLEPTLVPFLGTGLLVCTFVLTGLSVPNAFKELHLQRTAVGGTVFSPHNVERVKRLLPRAGFPEGVEVEKLASGESFRRGREVLLSKCVQCHDLRTVLLRPRTPENWVQTVQRMSERAVFSPISEEEQWSVSAYLIAISPELQHTYKRKREQERGAQQSRAIVTAMLTPASMAAGAKRTFDLSLAKETFEQTCTQCHGLGNVERRPPQSDSEIHALIERMVENGLEASAQEIEQVIFYLKSTYMK